MKLLIDSLLAAGLAVCWGQESRGLVNMVAFSILICSSSYKLKCDVILAWSIPRAYRLYEKRACNSRIHYTDGEML